LSAIGGVFEITFHGVRGSTPCHGEATARYGGNTSCVSVAVPGADPLLFDLGTGLRYFGLGVPGDVLFRGTCLLTHLHWDHVQGLPFFTPLLRHGAHLDVYAPVQEDGSSPAGALHASINPPLFPIGLQALPGNIDVHGVGDADWAIGDVEVRSRLIPHVGNTLGYRVSWGGASVAYLSDHQQPSVHDYSMSDGARDLCDGVDVLIHDAQYTYEEFLTKSDWGHCTIEYALWLAQECGVKTLVLYHHDPMHDDDIVDELTARCRANAGDVQVVAAREGLVLTVGG
jgi:phosphoribosyl 1,2-cyclic phosphodiesterase